jgi:Zn-finger nucleic acid-binding protein
VDASALHCPNCGAAVDPTAHRCPFCRARLATVSCPACFALMFEEATFCTKCGARRARTEPVAAGARCPKCRNELQQVTIGSASLFECPRCDGVWLDAEAFERICADRESQATVLHRWTASPGPTAAEPVRYRPCVRCGKMMNRINFGRLSGTIVDVCRGHGTFLDTGELHAVVAFIQQGGLERMRAREIDDLKEEQRRLKEAQSDAAWQRRPVDGRVELAVGTWDATHIRELFEWLKPDL